MGQIDIVPALPEMARTLSDLAWRAKSHWGYPETWMEAWKSDLTLSPEFIRDNLVEVALKPEGLLGFYAIDVFHCELEHMWIDPAHVGQGVGRHLFQRINAILRDAEISSLTIISDPHADGFYAAMGATPVGAVESLPRGRYLTKFSFRTVSSR